ncbi:MAG TPA: hypothetical protein VGD69_30595 [Herpetosiphonaceae bacterium]
MAKRQRNEPADPGRTDINVRRKGGLVQHVVTQTARQVPEDPDAFVDKTYKVRKRTVERVKAQAQAANVGIGELVDWALTKVLDDLDAGTLTLPVGTVQIEVPVLGGRRVGRPALRRIAQGTIKQRGTAQDEDHT